MHAAHIVSPSFLQHHAQIMFGYITLQVSVSSETPCRKVQQCSRVDMVLLRWHSLRLIKSPMIYFVGLVSMKVDSAQNRK